MELEGDQPEVLVSALTKLSRKFAENEIITQLKTSMSLHYAVQHVEESMGVEFARAIVSMMREIDGKTGTKFFDTEGIELAKRQAESVLELELAALEDIYSEYLIDLLKQRISQHSKHGKQSKPKLDTLLRLLEDNNSVQEMASKIEGSSLAAQLVEFLERDRPWLGQQLLDAYEVS